MPNVTFSNSAAQITLGVGATVGLVIAFLWSCYCCMKGTEIDPRKPLSKGWLKG